MMSVVSAMSVMKFMSCVTARVLCLYLPTHTHTTDTTHINNLIVRAREADSDVFVCTTRAAPQFSPSADCCEVLT